MQIINDLVEWQKVRNNRALSDKTIGYVPTMGNLHAGHESLLRRSKNENTINVLSIFVNPKQFDDLNDYLTYPKTLIEDCKIAKNCGVDYLLAPTAEALFMDDFTYRIEETHLSTIMEGHWRPNHFSGMLTIVLKLLNLVMPTHLYLGEKDYQQLLLIKNMIFSFYLPIKVVACPTVREENGLAMSSRNNRLTEQERNKGSLLSQLLLTELSTDKIQEKLTELGFEVEYITEYNGRRFGAVKLGNVRLIDNIALERIMKTNVLQEQT